MLEALLAWAAATYLCLPKSAGVRSQEIDLGPSNLFLLRADRFRQFHGGLERRHTLFVVLRSFGIHTLEGDSPRLLWEPLWRLQSSGFELLNLLAELLSFLGLLLLLRQHLPLRLGLGLSLGRGRGFLSCLLLRGGLLASLGALGRLLLSSWLGTTTTSSSSVGVDQTTSTHSHRKDTLGSWVQQKAISSWRDTSSVAVDESDTRMKEDFSKVKGPESTCTPRSHVQDHFLTND